MSDEPIEDEFGETEDLSLLDGPVAVNSTDDGESYSKGDRRKFDAEQLEQVDAVLSAAQAAPAGETRQWAVLGALHELYGDDLVVL